MFIITDNIILNLDSVEKIAIDDKHFFYSNDYKGEHLQFQFIQYFLWKCSEAGHSIPGIGTGQMSMLMRLVKMLNPEMIILTTNNYLSNLKTSIPGWWGLLNRLENNPIITPPPLKRSWRSYVLQATSEIKGEGFIPEDCDSETRDKIGKRARELREESECG